MSFSATCFLLIIFYAYLDSIIAKTSDNFIQITPNYSDCKGVSPAVCTRRLLLFPFPRVGRRMDPTTTRSQRSFGMLKMPRIGRSESMFTDSNVGRIHVADEAASIDSSRDFGNPDGIEAYLSSASGEKNNEYLKNLENYISAYQRQSGAPWTFFLVKPKFQSPDHQQTMDNLISQLGQESFDENE